MKKTFFQFISICAIGLLSFNLYAEQKNPLVELDTSMGKIIIELYPDKAPKTVENFLNYVKSGFYNGTIFHRVIKNFMIQGGGYNAGLKKLPTHEPIQNEANNGLKNERGTIAMARTSYPHSATTQFFINTKNNAFLNFSEKTRRGWGYAVFGTVVKGMDVVDKIEAVKTTSDQLLRNLPVKTIKINQIKLLNETTENE